MIKRTPRLLKKTFSTNNDLPIISLDSVQHQLFHQIETTSNSYVIQGQAGTGKSTFIKYLQTHTHKKIRLLCPTAIAALHIGGVTIHSLFQLPFRDFFIPEQAELKQKTIQILKRTEMIVIDEISMVRPDILDTINYLLQKARGDYTPFGGVQMILVGDLCQLPPVIKQTTAEVFRQKYGFRNAYFFDAKSYKVASFHLVQFQKVYRQTDRTLLSYLTDIRHHHNLNNAVNAFNKACIQDEEELKTAITITPYKADAEKINQERLEELPGGFYAYPCTATGYFNTSAEAPAPRVLKLKPGAVVLFNKNNPPYWINGSSGVIVSMEEDIIWVRLFHNNRVVAVRRETWQSFSYEYKKETDSVEEKETGSFVQFPIQPGYALTIHKAQGKTLDKVIINMSTGAFAHGQIYVALSRTRRLSDIHLQNQISVNDIIADPRIVSFLKNHMG